MLLKANLCAAVTHRNSWGPNAEEWAIYVVSELFLPRTLSPGPSTVLSFLNQIASLRRLEDRHTHRHRERQDEDDDCQFGTPVGILATPHPCCRASGEDEQERERQGCAWGGENVDHWGRIPHRTRTGLQGKQRYRGAFLIVDGPFRRRHP